MDFNEFQNLCKLTDVGRRAQDRLEPGWMYYVLGIAGETGEFIEKVKKLFRDKSGKADFEFKKKIGLELGDILWYMARLCDELGVPFDDIPQLNVEKLQSRQKRDKLHGDGDNR